MNNGTNDVARNIGLICVAAFLRSMSTGTLGVVLAVYLSRNGLSATWIGAVIASGLAGSAVATALISYRADVIGTRRSLVLLAILSAFGGIVLIMFRTPIILLGMGFIVMLNGMGTDRSAAFAIEQAAIPNLVSDRQRTWVLSWYNVVLDAGGALGALAGALPVVIERSMGLGLESAYLWVFAGFTVANLSAACLYLFLTDRIELQKSAHA